MRTEQIFNREWGQDSFKRGGEDRTPSTHLLLVRWTPGNQEAIAAHLKTRSDMAQYSGRITHPPGHSELVWRAQAGVHLGVTVGKWVSRTLWSRVTYYV